MNDLREKLKNYRDDNKLSFYKLAFMIGISETALVSFLKNKTKSNENTRYYINKFILKENL